MPTTPPTIAPPKSRGKLKMRALRLYDDAWDNAMAEAKANGLTLTEVIDHYLLEYGAPQRRKSRKK